MNQVTSQMRQQFREWASKKEVLHCITLKQRHSQHPGDHIQDKLCAQIIPQELQSVGILNKRENEVMSFDSPNCCFSTMHPKLKTKKLTNRQTDRQKNMPRNGRKTDRENNRQTGRTTDNRHTWTDTDKHSD